MANKRGNTNNNVRQAFLYSSNLQDYSATPPNPASGLMSGLVARVPSRRFYSPEILASYILMPKDRILLNRWRRFFFDHDPLVGAVLEALAITPYSEVTLIAPDKRVKQIFEDMLMDTSLISLMPTIDLEYMKIGEVFPFAKWNSKKGYFDEIVILNPDYVEVMRPAFLESKPIIRLKVDPQLRNLIKNRELAAYIRKMNPEIVSAIMRGQDIDPNKLGGVIHQIARKSSPYDLHGRSVIDRLLRILMFEDKIIEAMITIADNYVYPIKIFKLGDPSTGFIPDVSHAQALRQLLEQARFDPNFAIIFHYAINTEIVGFNGSFVDLSNQFDQIDKRKLIALGVGPEFLQSSRVQSLNAALELYLTRLRAKRDKFVYEWIYPVLFKQVAKAHGFYRRTRAELDHNVRITPETDENLIIPKIEWQKRLSYRDSSDYLQFIMSLWEKELVSSDTLLSSAGFNFIEEVNKRVEEQQFLERKGLLKKEEQQTGGGGGIFGSLFGRRKKASEEQEIDLDAFTFSSVMKSRWDSSYKAQDLFYTGVLLPKDDSLAIIAGGEIGGVSDTVHIVCDLSDFKKSKLGRAIRNIKVASIDDLFSAFNLGRKFASNILHKVISPLDNELIEYYLQDITKYDEDDRRYIAGLIGYVSALDDEGYYYVWNIEESGKYEKVKLSEVSSLEMQKVGFIFPDPLPKIEQRLSYQTADSKLKLVNVPATVFHFAEPFLNELVHHYNSVEFKVIESSFDEDFVEYVKTKYNISDPSLVSNMLSYYLNGVLSGSEVGAFVLFPKARTVRIGVLEKALEEEHSALPAIFEYIISQLPPVVQSKLIKTKTILSPAEILGKLLSKHYF